MTSSASNTSVRTRRPARPACGRCRSVSRRAARSCAHRHQRPHPALVAGPPRLDALAQPDFFLGQPLVELLLRDGLVREPLLLLSQERRVVARPRRQRAAIDLDDPGRQPLQERAIVGDEHDRAAIVGEEALEPGDGVDVEVVGRLVEQQHVGLGRPARAPAARAAASRPTGCRRCASAGRSSRDRISSTLCSRQPVLERRELPASALVTRVLRPRRRRRPTGSRSVARPGRAGPRAARAVATPNRRRARTSPLMICSSVDLPVPFLPMIDTRSPASICSDTSSSSGRWPKAMDTDRARRRAQRPCGSQKFEVRSLKLAEV